MSYHDSYKHFVITAHSAFPVNNLKTFCNASSTIHSTYCNLISIILLTAQSVILNSTIYGTCCNPIQQLTVHSVIAKQFDTILQSNFNNYYTFSNEFKALLCVFVVFLLQNKIIVSHQFTAVQTIIQTPTSHIIVTIQLK